MNFYQEREIMEMIIESNNTDISEYIQIDKAIKQFEDEMNYCELKHKIDKAV